VSSRPLYQTGLLGPLAEQLIEAAGIGRGMRVVDVLGDAGVLTRHVAMAVGPSGSVVTVVVGDAAARALHQELQESRATAEVVVASPGALPYQQREFDVAVSLLRLTGSVGSVALREMERVAHHAAVIVTAARRPAPEDLLAGAWQDATGTVPPALQALPSPPPPQGWTSTIIGDVARFDGAQQLWMALCDHLGIRAPDAEAATVRRRFDERLAPFQGADGTLRIPIEVVLLRRDAE
jgi:hypothetical protein